MSRFRQFQEAVKSPPPERLASIEYKSHLLQAIGIAFVCGLLIYKGYWYIIFAFIFGIGISYSQGMTAYAKYKMIMSLKAPEDPRYFESDISFTRRRGKIIKYVFGESMKFWIIVASVFFTFGIIPMTLSRWQLMFFYPVTIAISFFFLYYYFSYWFANPIYKRDMKGGDNNAERKKEKN